MRKKSDSGLLHNTTQRQIPTRQATTCFLQLPIADYIFSDSDLSPDSWPG